MADAKKIVITPRQRKAVELMVADSGKPISKTLIEAGYSDRTARTPQKVTESQGYLALLDEYGLTEETLGMALHDDIVHKPRNRYKELELAYRLRGRLNPNNSTAPDVSVNIAFVNTLDTD